MKPDTGSAEAASLAQAFAVFNETSRTLSEAYTTLQVEIARLNDELAQANAKLRDELLEKERLHQRLALLLQALPGAVVSLDPQGVIQDINPEARRMFGAEAVGRPWTAVAAESLNGAGSDWRLRRGSGDELRLTLSINQLPEGQGRLLLMQDVTEARQREEAFQRRERLATLGETMAGLAHQLRTPLATALLSISQLTPGTEPARFSRLRDRSLERLRSLERSINEMLRFLRGEGSDGAVLLEKVLWDLRQEFDDLLRQKNVVLDIGSIPSELILPGSGPAWVSVIGNILHNALQFSPAGSTIQVSAETDDDAVLLRIRDAGPGIAPQDSERVFMPFYSTRAGGTGLGLAIVRDFVNSMGGRCWMEAVEAPGACVALSVPLWRGAQALESGPLKSPTDDEHAIGER